MIMDLAQDRCIYTKRNDHIRLGPIDLRPASRVPTPDSMHAQHAITFLAISGRRRPANVVHARVFLASLAAHQRGQPPTLPSPTH